MIDTAWSRTFLSDGSSRSSLKEHVMSTLLGLQVPKVISAFKSPSLSMSSPFSFVTIPLRRQACHHEWSFQQGHGKHRLCQHEEVDSPTEQFHFPYKISRTTIYGQG